MDIRMYLMQRNPVMAIATVTATATANSDSQPASQTYIHSKKRQGVGTSQRVMQCGRKCSEVEVHAVRCGAVRRDDAMQERLSKARRGRGTEKQAARTHGVEWGPAFSRWADNDNDGDAAAAAADGSSVFVRYGARRLPCCPHRCLVYL